MEDEVLFEKITSRILFQLDDSCQDHMKKYDCTFCLFVLLWYGILTKIQCKLKNNILRNSSWSWFFFWHILFERRNNSDGQNILCILTWSSNQMKQMIWHFSPWVRQLSHCQLFYAFLISHLRKHQVPTERSMYSP